MSEFKGTPGPWFDDSTSRCCYDVTGQDGRTVIRIEADDEVDDFNFMLISAAPELLEVCIRMRNQLYAAGYDSKEKSLNPTEELLHQTEQAINKALGK